MGCGDLTAPELAYICIQFKLLVPADAPSSNVFSLFLWGVGELWSSRLTQVACLPVKPTRCGICNTAPKAPCPHDTRQTCASGTVFFIFFFKGNFVTGSLHQVKRGAVVS